MSTTLKPWGSFTNILDEEYTKVKKIVIKSGQSPSYQYHFKRSEIWIIVQGTAEVRLDGVKTIHGIGDIIKIPTEARHQPINVGDDDLIFIEVQLGEYFGEDDIVRLEDKYGRI
jgi:mannose-6-phosphate isomerase-like protein (cupin superfamily)